MDDCPLQKYIPIYLIVAGCFGVLKNVSSIAQRLKNRKEENDQENAKTNPFDGIVSCFLFVWFICGKHGIVSCFLFVWFIGGTTTSAIQSVVYSCYYQE